MMINHDNVYAVSEEDYDLMTEQAEAGLGSYEDFFASDWEEDAENLYGGEDSYIDTFWEVMYEVD